MSYVPSRYESRVRAAYDAFNRRDIDAVLATLSPGVVWANGMDGGYVHGRQAVRDYWTHQWQQINPRVDPIVITDLADGRVDVEVHQVVKDLSGTILNDRNVHHVYTLEGDAFSRMDIVG